MASRNVLKPQRLCPLTQGELLEGDLVIGADLPHLPQVGAGDGGGADEATQAGAVAGQHNGHVACTGSTEETQ